MIINKRNIITLTVLLLVSCAIFISFLNMHYATDTYNIIERGYAEYAIKYSLNDGRIFMCAITLIAEFINLPISIYIIVLTFFAIVTSCIAIMYLKNVIQKFKNPKNLFEELVLIIICFTIIFNFMYLENMQFAECFVMAISILLFLIAADILTQKEKNYILKSMFLTVLGILFYQGTLGFFVVMTFVFSIIKQDKKVLKNLFLCGVICLIAVAVNLFQIKICGMLFGMSQKRFGKLSKIFDMLKLIKNNLKGFLVNTIKIYPKYMFIGFFATVTIITNIYLIKKAKKWNLYIILLAIISLCTSFAINLFTVAGLGSARMLFPLGALVGNMFLLIYTNTDIFQNKKYFMSGILLIYCLSIVINYAYIIWEHTKVEELTKQECKIIEGYMAKYEKESGIKVTKIAVYNDTKPTYFYKNVKNLSALCVRPLSVEWGDNGSINYWNYRKLKEIKPDKGIEETYFKEKNWNSLDKEQFVFIDDVMHYCVY